MTDGRFCVKCTKVVLSPVLRWMTCLFVCLFVCLSVCRYTALFATNGISEGGPYARVSAVWGCTRSGRVGSWRDHPDPTRPDPAINMGVTCELHQWKRIWTQRDVCLISHISDKWGHDYMAQFVTITEVNVTVILSLLPMYASQILSFFIWWL
jgi:hypothetical protein